MQYLWIIDKATSAALFYRSYADLQIDPDLVSGLLAALNNFSEIELRSHGIESIDMGGLRWVYVTNEPIGLLLIAADEKSSNADLMRSRLEYIEKVFIQTYGFTEETLKKKLININEFADFSNMVDTLREQWFMAEKAMDSAALFDLLGVFQQLFNITNDIVRTYCQTTKQTDVFNQIQLVEKQLRETLDIQKYPDLSNITYDPMQGWMVLTLNPLTLNEDIIKRALFFITRAVVKILKDNLGKLFSLSAFNSDVFPYLFSSWDLLEKLKIGKSLIQIFIE
jgi:hypothetical protein